MTAIHSTKNLVQQHTSEAKRSEVNKHKNLKKKSDIFILHTNTYIKWKHAEKMNDDAKPENAAQKYRRKNERNHE